MYTILPLARKLVPFVRKYPLVCSKDLICLPISHCLVRRHDPESYNHQTAVFFQSINRFRQQIFQPVLTPQEAVLLSGVPHCRELIVTIPELANEYVTSQRRQMAQRVRTPRDACPQELYRFAWGGFRGCSLQLFRVVYGKRHWGVHCSSGCCYFHRSSNNAKWGNDS